MTNMLHTKTCKYSFLTLTFQAEDDFVIVGGDSVVHTMELNRGKPINNTPLPSTMSRGASCQTLSLELCLTPQ